MFFSRGHQYPSFGLLMMSSLGFKAREGSLKNLCLAEIYLRFTSGATPADFLAASIAAKLFFSTYLCEGIVRLETGI